MNKSKFILLVISFVASYTSIYAQTQEIRFERLTVEDGLSQNSVNAIVQDHEGFMWFGTQDGLNRYDGYVFTVFKHGYADSNSLSDNFISSLIEDGSGVLWIGTHKGLNRFDKATNNFKHYFHIFNDTTDVGNNIINVIYEDLSKNFWVGTNNGLFKFDRTSEQLVAYPYRLDDHFISSNIAVNAIYEDRARSLWIGTNEGLKRLDRESGKFISFKNNIHDANSLSGNIVLSIGEDGQNNLWVGTTEGLNRWNIQNGNFARFKHEPSSGHELCDNLVNTIFVDNTGIVWTGTGTRVSHKGSGGGLCCKSPADEWTHYSHNNADPYSLSDNNILAIYQDRSGVLWLGTHLGGINRYSRYRNKLGYKHYSSYRENRAELNVAMSFLDEQGIFFVGTYGEGLHKFHDRNKLVKVYSHKPFDPQSISNNEIKVIYRDRSNDIWVGTNEGLNKYISTLDGWTSYKNKLDALNSINSNHIRTILEDRSNALWIGTDEGLNLFDKKKETFTRFEHDPGKPNSISGNRINALCQDNLGNLWIGTLDGGLNRLDRKTNKFISYRHNPLNANSLISDRILSLAADKNGNIWIGTFGQGLDCFNFENDEFKHYTEKDGLPNEVINGILLDDHDNVWISTNKGISKFTPPLGSALEGESNPPNPLFKGERRGVFRNYDVSDGLQSNEFNQGAAYKNKRGEMFFGGVNGFNVFHPDSIKDNAYIPPVVITSFKKFNEEFSLPTAVTDTKELELSYRDYFFSFEFAALDFTAPLKNRYAYKMEGFDKDWNYTDAKRRFATYTNLNPGEYIFKVKGSNNDGIWNEEGSSLKITITPPFWATWWFRIMMVFILSGSIFIFLRVRIRNIEAQKQKLELQVAHRTQELHAAMEDLKQTQVRLVHAEKMGSLGNMVAGIAHEINNPLGFIWSNIEYFKDTLPKLLNIVHLYDKQTEQQQDQLVQEIHRLKKEIEFELIGDDFDKAFKTSVEGTRRILNIVDNLKRFTNAGFGTWEEVDIVQNLDTVCALFLQQGKNIHVEKHYAPIQKIWCSVGELNHGLGNLLTNAIQAIKDAETQQFLQKGAGCITVSVDSGTDDKNKHVLIRIKDNGIGIPQKNIGNIFDPFFTTRPVGYGQGLGLSEVYGIIKKHEGKIEVKSEFSKGTEFIITLPCNTDHPRKGYIMQTGDS